MPKFNLFHWLGVGTSTIMNLMGKASDGNVTLVEAIDVLETGIKQALPLVSDNDFVRFGAITSAAELEMFDFHDGDVLVALPVELVGKIKVEFGP